ncbi:phenylacetate--CoA ligase family protein, partial [Alcaligenes pakistanensis]
MSEYYDERETLEPAEREADLMTRLPQVLQAAAKGAPAIAKQLGSLDLAAVRSREDLLAIPVFR